MESEQFAKIDQRIQALEISDAVRTKTLENIETKLDTVINDLNRSYELFQTKSSHETIKGFHEESINKNIESVKVLESAFDNHLQSHYNKVDRFATWLTTAMIMTFVIARLSGII